jgi:hypothetical protein
VDTVDGGAGDGDGDIIGGDTDAAGIAVDVASVTWTSRFGARYPPEHALKKRV